MQDFSGQNLRGRSFKGQNLTGANFSGADIQSTNFTGANLVGANFSNAKAGLQKRWTALLLLISFLLAGVTGFFSTLTGTLVSYILSSSLENQVVGWIAFAVLIIIFTVIIRRGLNSAFAFAGAVAGAFAFAGAVAGAGTFAGAFAGAFAGTFAVAIAGTVTGIFAVAFAGTVTGTFAVAFAGAIAVTFATAFAVAGAGTGTGTFATALAFAVAGALFSIYIGSQSLQGSEKYALIRSSAIAFACFGGTSFYNANLTDANFTGAILKSTDFRKANLARTCFHKTKKLDHVRPGATYLKQLELLKVLVTGNGADKNFDRQDLRGVNLQGAILTDASFISADLSEANLQDTDLSRAMLVQTQLDSTDFTGANLTGAYIQDWGITSDTKFDGVHCGYVYMRLPTRRNPDPMRKPDNREEVFGDGEFGDFIKPIFDTLDLYHNQSVDPRAIAISFKHLAENHPDAELEIVGMEKRGEDKFLLHARTAPQADKSELSAEYFDTYNQIKRLPEREIRLLLSEKDSQIRRLENMVMTALERPNFYSKNGDITVGNINIEGGGINTGKIGNVGRIDNIQDVRGNIETIQTATIEENNDFYNTIEIQIIRGSGMLMGESSELVLLITNSKDKPVDNLEIEIQDSAEYEVISDNQVFLYRLEAGQSEEVSFSLKMSFPKQIAVNYKVNGKLKRPPLYINSVQDNPYIYGSPVEGEKAFFGRQKELEQIIQAVTKPTKQDILIVGERRTGKTSLLNQLQKRLNIPLVPVYVVINTSEEATTESILKLIINETLKYLVEQKVLTKDKLKEYSSQNIDFIKNYKEIIHTAKINISNLKIVLLLDEADYLLKVKQKKSNTIDERIQNILRAALQSSEIGTDLRAVVAATTELSTYISQHSSPFYNHFRFVHLKPLTVQETRELIVQPGAMLGYSYTDKAIEYITKLSGGQPYYTQAICYEAFENAMQATRDYISDEDISISEKKIVEDFFDSFLSGFWNRSDEFEKNFLIDLASANHSINISRVKIKRLLDWQLIREDIEGNYFLSSELIKQWIMMASSK